MGVKHLWSILQPVCKKEPLENMRGKTLCVDLSTWICQAEEIVPLKSAVAKPYLRNTIFRVLCLKRLGTQLIFVTEGTPPQLKWDVIVARAKAREEAEKEGKTFGKYSSKKKRPGNERQGQGVGSKIGKDNRNDASANCQPKKVGRSTFQRKINEVLLFVCFWFYWFYLLFVCFWFFWFYSLLKKVNEIFMKTKEFPRDLCENNRFPNKGVRDFKE